MCMTFYCGTCHWSTVQKMAKDILTQPQRRLEKNISFKYSVCIHTWRLKSLNKVVMNVLKCHEFMTYVAVYHSSMPTCPRGGRAKLYKCT